MLDAFSEAPILEKTILSYCDLVYVSIHLMCFYVNYCPDYNDLVYASVGVSLCFDLF